MADNNYSEWTRESLIEKIQALEAELSTQTPQKKKQKPSPEPTAATATSTPPDDTAPTSPPKPKAKKPKLTSTSVYSKRFIALKLAYLGKTFGGFEYQRDAVPTIEEHLWKALVKACLIIPEDTSKLSFDGFDYSKCGRTDRGVSAFGQVVGLTVRSKRPLPKPSQEGDEAQDTPSAESEFDDMRDEYQYCKILNSILPSEIRILAWCPNPPPNFSARHSCRERQYRYFFTQPAFLPTLPAMEEILGKPTSLSTTRSGWLDIEAMRDGARRFEGEHDFRNFCKIDPGKQITNFSRRIFSASIEEVPDAQPFATLLKGKEFGPNQNGETDVTPKVYSFNVNGSAFLWHQIRHMVSVLFLVGQGLEKPDIITTLLDVKGRTPCKPHYAMADEVPLVLWDCLFPDLDKFAGKGLDTTAEDRKDSLEWVYVGDENPLDKWGRLSLMEVAWTAWRERMMDDLLASRLMDKIYTEGSLGSRVSTAPKKCTSSIRLFEGGDSWRPGGKYVPMMERRVLESPEVQNEKWAKKCGYASSEAMRIAKRYRQP